MRSIMGRNLFESGNEDISENEPKSLVDTYLVEGKDSFICRVIDFVHDLDRKMVIEGVEEEWQYVWLKDYGADTIQGYFFNKPILADEAITFKV